MNPSGRVVELDCDGDGFTAWTTAAMADLVRRALRGVDFVNEARRIIGTVPDRAHLAQLEAIRLWVIGNIRYVRDPVGVELIQTPLVTLQEGVGDCDDHAILVVALAGAVGMPGRFKAIGARAAAFCHVVGEVQVDGRWVTAETTVPGVPLGWCAQLGRVLLQTIRYG